MKVRDSLKGEMAVVIDERDQAALAQHGEEDEVEDAALVERVHVNQRVRSQLPLKDLLIHIALGQGAFSR